MEVLTGYQAKALARDELNIEDFARRHGIGRGNTFFFTLTFRHNITDKLEASDYWHNMYTAINKEFKLFRYAIIWERQKRGAWHCHLLCNCPLLSMNRFCKFVKGFIMRSGKPYGFINAKWTTGRDYKGITYYLTKYLTKESREPRIRYVGYSRNWSRCCRMPFAWMGGKSGQWRERCTAINERAGGLFKMVYPLMNYSELLRCIALPTVEESVAYLRSVFKTGDSIMQGFWRSAVEGVMTGTETVYKPIYNFDGRVIDVFEKRVRYRIGGEQ